MTEKRKEDGMSEALNIAAQVATLVGAAAAVATLIVTIRRDDR